MESPLKPVKLKNNLWAAANDERLMLFFSLAAVLIVNIQVLFTFFYADDFIHLYQIANWSPLEFIFSSFGGHLYIFRNLIFYCMFKLFGLNSVAYFSIVLLTHLVNAYLLYKIIHLLTDKKTLAAAGMMIWGISFANYPSLSWYSAYGHLLVAFFFLLWLYDLLRIEKKALFFSGNMAIRWSIYLFLMGASYGMGLAIVCLSPAVIVIILWENDEKWKITSAILPAIALILLLFIFKDAIYYYFSGEISNSKASVFGAALSDYKYILKLFIGQCFLNIAFMAAFPVFFLPLTTESPMNLFFIAIPIVMLFIILFFRSCQYRRSYAGLSIFFLGIMALLASEHGAGGILSIYPTMMIIMETRFYYITLMIVVMMLALMADELLNIFPNISKKIVACVFITIAVSIYPSIHLAKKNDSWNHSEKDKIIYHDTIFDIKKTIRAYPEGSSVFIDNTMNEEISFFPTLHIEFPGKAAIFAITYPHNTFEGRRAYFVEKDCHIVDKNIEKKHWRASSLIVSACDRNKGN